MTTNHLSLVLVTGWVSHDGGEMNDARLALHHLLQVLLVHDVSLHDVHAGVFCHVPMRLM